MLISIHTNSPLPTAAIGPTRGEDAIWIDLAVGQSILVSALEAAHLCSELQRSLEDLDRRDALRHTELDLDPLASLPLFDVVDA